MKGVIFELKFLFGSLVVILRMIFRVLGLLFLNLIDFISFGMILSLKNFLGKLFDKLLRLFCIVSIGF